MLIERNLENETDNFVILCGVLVFLVDKMKQQYCLACITIYLFNIV